jgi:hypothetical protein
MAKQEQTGTSALLRVYQKPKNHYDPFRQFV